jgi:ParB-like chromosome segregation protein Spo0J
MAAAKIAPEIGHLAVPVDTLRSFHGNARQGALPVIRDSLLQHGQYRPIVVNRGEKTGRPNEVLAGNHTLAGAIDLGWDKIAVTWVDVDDDAAKRIVLVDNRSNDLAGYDDRLLVELIESLDDKDIGLEGTGYTDADLAKLVSGLREPDFDIDPDQPSLDSVAPKECPSCGFQWRDDGRGGFTPV